MIDIAPSSLMFGAVPPTWRLVGVGRDGTRARDALAFAGGGGLFFLLLSTAGGSEDFIRDLDNVIETGAPFAAAFACLGAARRRTAARRSWQLLTGCALSWGVGQTIWSYHESIAQTDQQPFPSLADVGYVLAVPLLILALLAFPTAAHPAGRLRSLIDGLIIACAVLGMSWAFVIAPVVSASQSAFATAVALSYPVGDVVALVVALAVLARASSEWRPTLTTIVLAVTALAVADSAFAYNISTGGSTTSGFNAGWVVGFLLLTMAARDSAWAPSTDSGRLDQPRWLVSLPFIPVIVFALTALPNQLANGHVHNGFVWTGVPMVLLMVLRQQLVIRENFDLTTSLKRQIEALDESRVSLRHQALHDPLTDLPNRSHLMRELAARFDGTHDAQTALLLMDLDRFKEINDGLGHDVGDQVLREVGERLRTATPSGDTVVRLGGDEFALLVDDPPGEKRPDEVAAKLLDAFAEPIEVDGMALPLEASIGIAHSADANDATNLLQCADVAMYRAKRQGVNVAHFGPEDQE
ncbi:MAG TPA: GGDEF domain-containing protein, partial [Acidimicrobiales bacterium]|nr:GGDEF domain-containing protein [Acidimicrobiales bacterium]